MLVGVDFDNSIVCYDSVIYKVALEKVLIPEDLANSKRQVRDYLRQQGLEDTWIELQGYVYGKRMLEATPFPGALEFFGWCKDQGIDICIISHRTRHPFLGPQFDLHRAAKDWIEHNGFYKKSGLSPDQVFFELSMDEKLNRIKSEGCHMFIDDLPEFLARSAFPKNVRCILFDPNNDYPDEKRFERAASWNQIINLLTI